MQRRYFSLLITFIILVLGAAALWLVVPSMFSSKAGGEPIPSSGKLAMWEYEDSCFILEVADTIDLRRQGLSSRPPLKDNNGMLFLYDLSGEYGFWMKDMNFAIDIVWLDKDDEVITVESRVSPQSYPHVFYPTGNAKKVIEVTAGVVEELGVKVGDRLRLSAPTSTAPVDCAML